MHVPRASQTRSTPQVLPASLSAPSSQAGVAPQAVTPCAQGFRLVVQVCPAVQVEQVPPRQIFPVSQGVPFGEAALSSQTRVPLVHRTTPVTHAPPGLVVHALPWSHSKHVPAEVQTFPGPHDAPVCRGVAVSTQLGVAPHVVFPSRHGFGFVEQGRSASH